MFDKIQKLVSRTVGHSRAASIKPLPHRRNIASLGFF